MRQILFLILSAMLVACGDPLDNETNEGSYTFSDVCSDEPTQLPYAFNLDGVEIGWDLSDGTYQEFCTGNILPMP